MAPMMTTHREELRQTWPMSSKVVVGIARDLAAHRMGTWGVPQKVIDDVLVVVSEAMTNVFKHVKKGPVKLHLAHQGDAVLAEIWDCAPIAPALRPLDPDTEGGMGLHIIAGLTENRCGHRWDSGGKTVYGFIPIP